MRNRFIKTPSRNHEYKNVHIYKYIKPVIQYYAHEFEYSRIYIYVSNDCFNRRNVRKRKSTFQDVDNVSSLLTSGITCICTCTGS